MTRDEIVKEYRIERGVIRSPGKFEGQPMWVPYYWELGLEGAADEETAASYTFNIDASDVETWPTLRDVRSIELHETEQGFVEAFTRGRP